MRLSLATVSVFAVFSNACSHPHASVPAAVHIDITSLQRAAETAQITVSKVGLLAIQGAAVDPSQAQQMVQTSSGASDSTASVDPTSGDQSSKSSDAPVTGGSDTSTTGGAPNVSGALGTGSANTGAARGTSTTSTDATPAAGSGVQPTASPKAVAADGVIASVAAGGAAAGAIPKFGYYPVAISPTDLSFDVAIPSGDNQTLVFLAFITDPTTGHDDPVYIGERAAVDLKSTETLQLAFDIYAAGTVRPEILAPSTLGLTDTSGSAITSVPSLNCLAVATSSDSRSGFPSTTASRVAVGALASLNAAQIASGALILPVGDWGIDCTANYAGHLFGVSSDRPMVVTVAQGHVYSPSAPLVVVKDLPAAGSSGGAGGASSGSPPGNGAHLKAPRLDVMVGGLVAVTLARGASGGSTGSTTGTAIGGLTSGLGSTTGGQTGSSAGSSAGGGGNLTSLVNQDVSITALDDNGLLDPSFNGVVRLTVVTLGAKEIFPIGWQPFDSNHQSVIPRSADVAMVNGTAFFTGLVQTSTLPADALTHHFLVTAQALNANGNPLDPSGAMAITVRNDLFCSGTVAQNAGVGAITPFGLSANANTVTAGLDATGTYTEPTVPLMVIATSGDASDCIINAPSDMSLLFSDISPPGVIEEPTTAFSANADGSFVVPLPSSGDGQWLYWDAFRISPKFLSNQTPAVGASTTVSLPYSGPNQVNGQLSLNAVIVASP